MKLLLVTPPFVQPNCPYPATPYLKGYLAGKGYDVEQYDLSIELLHGVFSPEFLREMFAVYERGVLPAAGTAASPAATSPAGAAPARPVAHPAPASHKKANSAPDPPPAPAPATADPLREANLSRIYSLRESYISTVGAVMDFLCGGGTEMASLICGGNFLPQASRFDNVDDLSYWFGSVGTTDCARFLCTLYMQDLSDFIRATVTPHFEIARYAEKLSVSIPEFRDIEPELERPANIVEQLMTRLLAAEIARSGAGAVGFTVPFPGNLLGTLRCVGYVKETCPGVKTIMGGGYPSTELREMTDKGLFEYIDYCILDDGEVPLERILSGGPLVRTYTAEGYVGGEEHVTHAGRGCPDFGGLPYGRYFSLTEVTNPMHRRWSDGRWNKMMVAHGCYWAGCAFCDTSLDYICRYDSVPAATFVDWMERVMAETGSRGFHFVDEAAPPKMLKEISLEILRRGLKVSWWTNIRFESSFTGDLAALMASAGCIAVSGGLEAASDRLLELMNKGVTIEQATMAMRNFYYAGIMVHTYLMYGFPTETLQDTVDSLEVVRQMFRAELINSAFWHRYAMTVHSPSGREPGKFGVRVRGAVNGFANNETGFSESRDYNIGTAGEALGEALANYLCGNGIDRPVHKWFKSRDVPPATVENSLVTDHLIKPDASRIYDPSSRVVWTGPQPERTAGGVMLRNGQKEKDLALTAEMTPFVLELTAAVRDLSRKVTFADAAEMYKKYSDEPFVIFFLSKKWDVLRSFGMLKI